MASTKQLFAFDPTFERFAAITPDNRLKIWETVTGTLKQQLAAKDHLTARYSGIAWGSSAHVRLTKQMKFMLLQPPPQKKQKISKFSLLINYDSLRPSFPLMSLLPSSHCIFLIFLMLFRRIRSSRTRHQRSNVIRKRQRPRGRA